MRHFLHRHFVAPLGPCIAEIGRSIFAANAAVAVFAFLAEYARPGFAVQTVSPYVFVAVGIASAALSLAAPGQAPAAWGRAMQFAATAVLAAFAGWSAWYYFISVPEARFSLAAVAMITVAYAGAAFVQKYE